MARPSPRRLSPRCVSSTIVSVKPVPGTLGAGGAAFQPTRWSVVKAAQSQSPEEARAALTSFYQDYWPPLYAFVRRRGHSPSDAEDLIQAFFTHLLEGNALRRVDREKGKLRTFLLGSLQHFLANEYHRDRALKRGGAHQMVSLEEHHAEAEAAALAAPGIEDGAWYDQAWAVALTRRAWEAVQRRYTGEGKGPLFEALKPFLLAGTSPPSHDGVAASLGIPIATLRTHVHRLRQRYRETVRAEVAETLAEPGEIDAEMRHLFRALMS